MFRDPFRNYDQWKTASPYDDDPVYCTCGHDLDDHIDVTDMGQVARRAKKALEAIRDLRLEESCKRQRPTTLRGWIAHLLRRPPKRPSSDWTIDDWITYGLGACSERGCDCKEAQECDE